MFKSKQRGWIYVKSKENNNNIHFTNKINNKIEINEKNKNNSINNDKANKKNKKKEIEYNIANITNDKEDNNPKNEYINEYLNNNSDDDINQINYNYEENDSINSDKDKLSFKKILCYNIIYNGSCKYGDKCLYAHSLEDQNINKSRKDVYDILKSEIDLSDIDLKKNEELYETMLEMTKYCKNCNNNVCKGGYNCKSGVFDKKYCICVNDLKYGFCHNYNCNFVHLTNRGLKPYYDDKNKKNNINGSNNINENIFYIEVKNNKKEKNVKLSLDIRNNNENMTDDSNENFSEIEINNSSSSDSEISDINSIDSNNFDKNESKNINYQEYMETICNKSIFQ